MIKLREGLWINPSYVSRIERYEAKHKGTLTTFVRINSVDDREYVIGGVDGDDPDRVLRAIEDWFPARDPDADGMDARDMYSDTPLDDKE